MDEPAKGTPCLLRQFFVVSSGCSVPGNQKFASTNQVERKRQRDAFSMTAGSGENKTRTHDAYSRNLVSLTGMRGSCDILIFIDLQKALKGTSRWIQGCGGGAGPTLARPPPTSKYLRPTALQSGIS